MLEQIQGVKICRLVDARVNTRKVRNCMIDTGVDTRSLCRYHSLQLVTVTGPTRLDSIGLHRMPGGAAPRSENGLINHCIVWYNSSPVRAIES